MLPAPLFESDNRIRTLAEDGYNSSFIVRSRFLQIGPLKRLYFEQLLVAERC